MRGRLRNVGSVPRTRPASCLTVPASPESQPNRQSVGTLTKTLAHVEAISKDLSVITGDARTQSNLRQLIESLSRLVDN